MKRYLIRILAIAFFVVTLPGAACLSQALPVLTQITSIITNAQNELSRVDHYVRDYMRATDAPKDVQDRYSFVYDKVIRGINIASSTMNGVTDLSQEQYDSAFSEFFQAWKDLEAFLKDTGAMNATGKLGARGTVVDMPKPTAIGYKVQPQ